MSVRGMGNWGIDKKKISQKVMNKFPGEIGWNTSELYALYKKIKRSTNLKKSVSLFCKPYLLSRNSK